jgi:EmrB/QacA subfamily drug resistance transporter
MANLGKPPCDEGVILGGTDTTSCSFLLRKWVLAATILGSSLAFIDGTVVNVALPAIQKDLNATASELQWVVESYALFLAALVLVGGSLGDHYGRRRIFGIGVIIFAITSAICGFAPDSFTLIMARAAQGIGGALLVPSSLALISATFPPEERGQAIGTWSSFTTITSALGPVLGGWLVENISWRAAFLINIPLAGIVLAIIWLRLPESRNEAMEGTKLDWLGAGLATIGLGALVFGLIEAGSLGLGNPLVVVSLISGVVTLVVFGVVEGRLKNPMMPLKLFQSRTFSGANLLTLFMYAALGASMYYFPLNLVQVQGYSPAAAGAALLPFTFIMFFLSRWAGGLVSRVGAKILLVVGTLIASVGMFMFSLPGIDGNYWLTFFPAIIVLGIGMAIVVAPITTTVMGAVDSGYAGTASGINNAVARTAGLIAIAVVGIVVTLTFNSSLDKRISSLELPPNVRQQVEEQRDKLAGAEITTASAELRPKLQTAIKESFVEAYRLQIYINTVLALLSAIVAALLIEGKKQITPAKNSPVVTET